LEAGDGLGFLSRARRFETGVCQTLIVAGGAAVLAHLHLVAEKASVGLSL
jgi:hypothetical protein